MRRAKRFLIEAITESNAGCLACDIDISAEFSSFSVFRCGLLIFLPLQRNLGLPHMRADFFTFPIGNGVICRQARKHHGHKWPDT